MEVGQAIPSTKKNPLQHYNCNRKKLISYLYQFQKSKPQILLTMNLSLIQSIMAKNTGWPDEEIFHLELDNGEKMFIRTVDFQMHPSRVHK